MASNFSLWRLVKRSLRKLVVFRMFRRSKMVHLNYNRLSTFFRNWMKTMVRNTLSLVLLKPQTNLIHKKGQFPFTPLHEQTIEVKHAGCWQLFSLLTSSNTTDLRVCLSSLLVCQVVYISANPIRLCSGFEQKKSIHASRHYTYSICTSTGIRTFSRRTKTKNPLFRSLFIICF